MKEKVTGHSQYGFTVGKWCLTDLVVFCDKMTGFVDEGRAVAVAYLEFGDFPWPFPSASCFLSCVGSSSLPVHLGCAWSLPSHGPISQPLIEARFEERILFFFPQFISLPPFGIQT